MSEGLILCRRRQAFEIWRRSLRDDCVAAGKLSAFDSLGENVLRILYENRVEPTVKAVASEGLNGKRGSTAKAHG